MTGEACGCGEREKPVGDRLWYVHDYKCNHSAFSGYRRTPSPYSLIECRGCGKFWRTKAAYVDVLGKTL